jgi:hypothetical protein
MAKKDKLTPSDNRQQKAQHSRMGNENPKTGGRNFDETENEASEGRESGKNESGKYNKPTRGTGQQGGGERDKKR